MHILYLHAPIAYRLYKLVSVLICFQFYRPDFMGQKLVLGILYDKRCKLWLNKNKFIVNSSWVVTFIFKHFGTSANFSNI